MATPGSLPFTTLDVFTTTKFAGNPLAIVHLPSTTNTAITPTTLTQAQKQTLAREFNLSETVFLHVPGAINPSADNIPEFKLDIFTVDEELPFAGHPTIGAACHVLSRLSELLGEGDVGALASDPTTASGTAATGRGDAVDVVRARFLIKAGVLELQYNTLTGEARARIPHDVHIHASSSSSSSSSSSPSQASSPQGSASLAHKVLSWQPKLAQHLQQQQQQQQQQRHQDPAHILTDIHLVSPVRGMSFLIVALPSLEALDAVATTGQRIKGVQRDEGWDFGPMMVLFYVPMPPAEAGRSDATPGMKTVTLRTRMIEGAFEDPATGSASCALAAMLALRDALGDSDGADESREVTTRFDFVQGVEMGRRSEIGVEVVVERGRVRTVELVGNAVEVMSGRVLV